MAGYGTSCGQNHPNVLSRLSGYLIIQSDVPLRSAAGKVSTSFILTHRYSRETTQVEQVWIYVIQGSGVIPQEASTAPSPQGTTHSARSPFVQVWFKAGLVLQTPFSGFLTRTLHPTPRPSITSTPQFRGTPLLKNPKSKTDQKSTEIDKSRQKATKVDKRRQKSTKRTKTLPTYILYVSIFNP